MNALAQDLLSAAAATHLGSVLTVAMEHGPGKAALVLSDARSGLAEVLAAAYRVCLPAATHASFYALTEAEVLGLFASLRGGDLVVCVQSTSFRMENFRIRVELFKRGIKVIEHCNLDRMTEAEWPLYVASLAYDPAYYRGVGNALKARLDAAMGAEIQGAGASLRFDSQFEEAKLNTGDFSATKNVGSMFPIGEVFTEARDLERVHGEVKIYGFADLEFRMRAVTPPISLRIEKGRVVEVCDCPPAFDQVLAKIRADEGEVLVRELGFGMNRAFAPDRMVGDVGAFERVCGVHLSLGAKHGVYKKPGLRNKDARHHVDVFPIADRVFIDGQVVFADGAWCPEAPIAGSVPAEPC